jgi:hypothetical protein
MLEQYTPTIAPIHALAGFICFYSAKPVAPSSNLSEVSLNEAAAGYRILDRPLPD